MGKPGSDLAGRERVIALAKVLSPIVHQGSEQKPFQNRGFSERTIKALVDCSIDAPERLLFMTERQLQTIPGVGKACMTEIRSYRQKYLGSVQGAE
ncbi:hypothetical protein [Bradyrhizobium sp. AC87j1]|uniref:hypothetical protein n=1 Tax=Bradyrhizobium sp. AC87j1 TaxID=2055894 RepID=UPI0011B05EE2|nr:hypothetical protein [Bradyrhizobium sp. AC87j1]